MSRRGRDYRKLRDAVYELRCPKCEAGNEGSPWKISCGECFGLWDEALVANRLSHPIDGDYWGPWQFRRSNLTLELFWSLPPKAKHPRYAIDLGQIHAPESFLQTIDHQLGKIWCDDATVLGQLIHALKDLLPNFNRWVYSDKGDYAQHLRDTTKRKSEGQLMRLSPMSPLSPLRE